MATYVLMTVDLGSIYEGLHATFDKAMLERGWERFPEVPGAYMREFAGGVSPEEAVRLAQTEATQVAHLCDHDTYAVCLVSERRPETFPVRPFTVSARVG